MSDKHLKSPDERWESTSKDTTREPDSSSRNKQKPDDVRVKDDRQAKGDEESQSE